MGAFGGFLRLGTKPAQDGSISVSSAGTQGRGCNLPMNSFVPLDVTPKPKGASSSHPAAPESPQEHLLQLCALPGLVVSRLRSHPHPALGISLPWLGILEDDGDISFVSWTWLLYSALIPVW